MPTAATLTYLIERSGMTQATIARRLGVTLKWLNNRKLGITPIKADEIPRLAAVLGVRPADFFEESQPAWAGRPGREGTSPAYADIFAREVARIWQGEEMTDAEREFLASSLESMRPLIQRYRDRIMAEETPAPRPEEEVARELP